MLAQQHWFAAENPRIGPNFLQKAEHPEKHRVRCFSGFVGLVEITVLKTVEVKVFCNFIYS